MEQQDWEKLSPTEKKKQLYTQQKKMLDLFLEKNAISRAQYDKSLGDITQKMGMQDLLSKIVEDN